MTVDERKARVLIKLRGYKIIKREQVKEIVSFLVESPAEKWKKLIWCIPTEGTVGVQYINQLKKVMKDAEIERAIIVSGGRYTQAAKAQAKKKEIEFIPRIFPSFNIFDHTLVPKHEIVSDEEKQRLLTQYRIQPYQLPQIRSSDPAAKAIGAEAGDILRITRKSPTSGEYTLYRYVVEG